MPKIFTNKTEPVVSDHLGQPTHDDDLVLFRSIMKSDDVRTPRVNIVITTGICAGRPR